MRETAELFKVLAVDTRIKIIELLKKKGPLYVNALAETLGVSQSAVSQHLRILKQAGLVRDERKGYWIPYSIDEEALERCRGELEKVCTCGCSGLAPLFRCCLPPEPTKDTLMEYKKQLERELKQVKKRIKELGG